MRAAVRTMALLWLAFAGVAHAALDPLGDPAQFQRDIVALNQKPQPDGEPLARVVGNAVAADARLRDRCMPSKVRMGKLEPVTLDGMITSMIASGQIENAWIVSVTLESCPPADPIRILVMRGPDGVALQAFFAGQGESLAWPSLSRDVLRAAVGAIGQRLKAADAACTPKDLTPVSIKVTGTSPDFGPNQYGIRLRGSWNEVWSFEACGHRLSVPIAFRTNGTGGAYWDVDDQGVVYLK